MTVEIPKSSERSAQEQQDTKPSSYEQVLAEIEQVLESKDPAKQEAFIKDRVAELQAKSEPRTVQLMGRAMIDGFLHPETNIKRSMIYDSLRIDDPELYAGIFAKLEQIRGTPGYEKKSLREIMPLAVQLTIVDYFGNMESTDETNKKNSRFYVNESSVDSEYLSVSRFKKAGIAVCAEKASAAQNLTTFAGLESTLIFSEESQMGDEMPEGGHGYNVLRTPRGIAIYDPANSVLIFDEQKNIVSVQPAMYPITEDQFRSLREGGKVDVEHKNLVYADGKYQLTPAQKRTYAGPRKKP